MNTAQCQIGGQKYRLDYDCTRVTSGRIFHGTLYLERIVDFYCEVPDEDGEPLFSPRDTRAEIRKAVIDSILLTEKG